jgi:glycerophosphoryl diester phosphodiesterase
MGRRSGIAVVTVVALGAGLLGVGEPATAACPSVPAVAHRGGTERYGENTRNAFRYATSIGVNRWELDVRFDATDTPFVIHDPTLDRTTNGTGDVTRQDLSAARRSGLRTDDGQYVPSLYEVLTDAAARVASVFVEIKVRPTRRQWANLLARLDWTSMRRRVVLMSFDADTVLEARAAAPDVRTGLVENPSYRPAAQVTRYGGHYVKHQNSITAARLAEWSGPLAVYAWTVDDVAGWARMNRYAARLDGVITNRPAAYLRWAHDRTC